VGVSRDNPEILFVTAFAGILDLDAGELAYCNAGNEDPYLLCRGDAAIARLDGGGGPPLCARDDFSYSSAPYKMRRDELICRVTDGATDARNGAGEMYGRARLQARLDDLRRSGSNAEA